MCIVFLYGTAAWGYLKQILAVAKDTYTPSRQQSGINLPYGTVSLSNFPIHMYQCAKIPFYKSTIPHIPINAFSNVVQYDSYVLCIS